MFPPERYPLEPALWFATAEPAPDTVPLRESVCADIVIIGAGYAGLSTALHLAELGYKPLVLEARNIGFGGSGRNGGQLVPGLKHDPDDILQKFGEESGQKLIDFAAHTVSTVFDLIDRYKMTVPTARHGWIQPAHNQSGAQLAEKRAQQWQKQGADVDVLSHSELHALLGTDAYVGGWIDRRGGALQPLSYVRGLARVAQQLGATIHTETPIASISKTATGWRLQSEAGVSITAKKVVVCANAYSDGLWPGLKESIIDPNTYQTATEVLPQEVLNSIFPQGHVASDTRNLLLYFRKDHTGRFIMGGRGPFREPRSQDDWADLKRVSVRMFPQLANVKWEYHWCGRVAVTPDFYPHIHEPAPGLLIDIGCQGRGVGLQTAMGKALANYVHSEDPEALPLSTSKIQRIPLHRLRKLYVAAAITWYRMRDGR